MFGKGIQNEITINNMYTTSLQNTDENKSSESSKGKYESYKVDETF